MGGNTAHILAYLLNSASRQHLKFWTLQFPMLCIFKHTFPPCETCLHGNTTWSLAQSQQQSFLDFLLYNAMLA